MNFQKPLLSMLLASVLFLSGLEAQQPLVRPGTNNDQTPTLAADQDTPVLAVGSAYPVGASDDDRAFIDAARKSMAQATFREIGPMRRFTVNRKLSTDIEFVRELKLNATLKLIQANPDLALGPMKWPDIDPEQLKAILEVIMQFIQFLVDLFADNGFQIQDMVGILNHAGDIRVCVRLVRSNSSRREQYQS